MTKETKLLGTLVLAIVTSIFIINWAKSENLMFRPLIQDMRLIDSVKVADVLDQEKIEYYSDVKNHILYVNQAKTEQARVALAKVGFVIEYPAITKYNDLHKAYDEFVKQQNELKAEGPIWEEPAFVILVRLVIGGLVVIVLILAIVRPLLKELILDDEVE